MRSRCCGLGIMWCGIAAAVLLLPAQVAGQGGSPSTSARTPWGDPDLQGIWNFGTLTPMERPESLADQAQLTEEEAAAYEQRHAVARDRPNPRVGEECPEEFFGCDNSGLAYEWRIWLDLGTRVVSTRRTSLVVDPPDGRIPALTPAGEERRKAAGAAFLRAAGPEDLFLHDRCMVGYNSGPPLTPGPSLNIMQVFQSPGFVAIRPEIGDARVIPTDGRPPAAFRQWQGHPRGRWEGDTLVVETRHARVFMFATSATALHRLEERFTRTGDDELLYEVRVEDPTTWTRPWTFELPMTRSAGPLYEYGCHEGNYSITNMLSGARRTEQARPESAAR
ncbi:MAG: hypothetical protein OXF27_21575 [Acidobacteria bacterium]|nr:hypothetical protein [Acidobacteriota bacterium]